MDRREFSASIKFDFTARRLKRILMHCAGLKRGWSRCEGRIIPAMYGNTVGISPQLKARWMSL